MKTYDPKKIIVIFGARQLTGMAEDSIVTISPLGDGMQIYVGADGDVFHTFGIPGVRCGKMNNSLPGSCPKCGQIYSVVDVVTTETETSTTVICRHCGCVDVIVETRKES